MNQIATTRETPFTSETAGIMAVIERVALNPEVDVDKMQKLLDMQERILNRNAHQAFTAALAEMQAELPEVEQNGAIKHGDKVISKYAKFEDINEAVKPVLQKHGFAVSFRIKQADNKIEVTAILSHRAGHSEETSVVLPADTSGAKNAVQAQGSSMAYGKRYAMCALLNISTRGEDDDGNSMGIKRVAKEPAFKNAMARNTFCKNVFKSFSDAKSIDELKELAELNRGKLEEMTASGNEHDVLAVDEIRKRYTIVRGRLAAEEIAENDVAASFGQGFYSIRDDEPASYAANELPSPESINGDISDAQKFLNKCKAMRA